MGTLNFVLTTTFPHVHILILVCMEKFLLCALMCHCHNPFGCADTDSTSSVPCWLECFIELCSVWALDLKNEASVHSKPTMSGVSCLPPRSVPLYLSLLLSLSLTHSLFLWWASAVGEGLWSTGLTASCQSPSPHAKMHRSCLPAVGPTYL